MTSSGGRRAVLLHKRWCSPRMARLTFSAAVILIIIFYIIKPHSGGKFDEESPHTLVNRMAKTEKHNDLLYAKIEELEQKIDKLEKTKKTYPKTRFLTDKDRKRILITGGAGFVGSHLVDALMLQGHEVVVADNFFTGRKRNIEHWLGHPNFEILHHDIVNPLYIEVDEIYHLASPASPPHYMFNPVKTIKTNTMGTINVLGLAKRVRAKVVLASTSEVYGDPEVHPQTEDYWGHVNPIGPRACYDEGKRVAETLMYSYAKQENVAVRVARIFNTYGPRMHMNDGRVVSNFIMQALQGENITIYGSGDQTRSFQYVTDLVDGLISLMNSNYSQPINIGNPDEHTILEFAEIINNVVGKGSKVIRLEKATDDPRRRKPDITRARDELDWVPRVSFTYGLERTVEYFRDELNHQLESQQGRGGAKVNKHYIQELLYPDELTVSRKRGENGADSNAHDNISIIQQPPHPNDVYHRHGVKSRD